MKDKPSMLRSAKGCHAHIGPQGPGWACERGVNVQAKTNIHRHHLSLPRHGKTILEMMIVIATSSVLVSLAAGLFHHLSRAERLFRDTVAANRAQMRLAEDFRFDVRAAAAATLIKYEDQQAIKLIIDDETILYTPTPHGLLRESQNPDPPTRHRDEYRLGDVQLHFTIADGLATLTVMPEKLPPPARPRSTGPFRLVAAIAADRAPETLPTSSAVTNQPSAVIAPRPPEASP